MLLTWRLVFEDKGYALTTAENCTEAMTILGADGRQFDVVVTDLNMEQVLLGGISQLTWYRLFAKYFLGTPSYLHHCPFHAPQTPQVDSRADLNKY